MGALHEGHVELMRRARSECGACAISIFVNPTQFGPNEDYTRYPRNEEQDLELAREAQVELAFLPSAEEMYGDTRTAVRVDGLSDLWEGQYRPGHFQGVATVVAKLFHLLKPRAAYFGLKDFQQCAVLKRMVQDLDFDVDLRLAPTVREADGLALSSRNRYLVAEERAVAPNLYQVMQSFVSRMSDRPSDVSLSLALAKSDLEKVGFRVDYFALVDRSTLEPISTLDREAQLIAAAWLGATRLIDNCAVDLPI